MMPTYDPGKVSLSWGGIPARAVAAGEMFNFSFNNDTVDTYVGTKGEGAFVERKDKSGTVVVRLQDTSPTKAAWMALYASGQALPLLLNDRSNGAEAAGAAEARLARPPAMVKGDTMGEIEFTFKFHTGYILHVGQDLADVIG